VLAARVPVAEQPNERWATDMRRIWAGRVNWSISTCPDSIGGALNRIGHFGVWPASRRTLCRIA